MPLGAMVEDALTNFHHVCPPVSAVHITPSTLFFEGKNSFILFCSRETALSNTGWKFLKDSALIKAVFVDEFLLLTNGNLHAPVVIKEVMFILSNLSKLVCLDWSERKLGFSRLKNILEKFLKQSRQPVALTAYCDFVWWHVHMILRGSPYYDI